MRHFEALGSDVAKADVSELVRIQMKDAYERGYRFLFSVVIAVYNARDFLPDAIESVIAQTIGFEHIQIVLVDDGSDDGSDEVCLRYAESYPDNVVVVSQGNAGVSSARNAGLSKVRGKYVNFLDADDLWDSGSFECALRFFSEHDVPFVASKYVFFGAREGNHRLNYKFACDCVVDVLECHDYPQLSSSTCFFDARALEGRSFAEALSVSEDVRLVNEILLDELRYGVMEGSTYRYRRPEARDSAIGQMKQNLSWYFDTPRECSRYLFELSEAKHGSVLPFIQYTVMYDLQWRIRNKLVTILNDEQLAEYRSLIVGLLAQIDDRIICEQRDLTIDRCAYAFALKYGTTIDEVRSNAFIEDGELRTSLADARGNRVYVPIRDISRLSDWLVVEQTSIADDEAVIEGYVRSFCFRPQDLDVTFFANNRPYPAEVFTTVKRELHTTFGEPSVGKTGFRLKVPLALGREVRLKARLVLFGETARTMRFIFTSEDGHAQDYVEGLFRLSGDAIFRLGAPDALTIRRPVGEGLAKRVQSYKKLAEWTSIRNHAAPWEPVR